MPANESHQNELNLRRSIVWQIKELLVFPPERDQGVVARWLSSARSCVMCPELQWHFLWLMNHAHAIQPHGPKV
ncbi:hypothetical protein AC578_10841 [Pseudocercospora eumusae]|uniref:Uncharacterized protein n=1 Tax=Pseudocercospora eumusae TaxID=321146 RepID=A0A139H8R2_9PEZI|nr:hypothetical protein AC578_10841 [Pseudocercospora eumusae]